MTTDRITSVESVTLAVEVEDLLDSTEPDGVFRDSRECAGAALLAALLLASPPTPRPKPDAR
ncbi:MULTISPECIES: hypothetical protein [Streptomyces]|uniref:Uncharacterized protein n=1 Tax=Streptomyces ramulosus TaxID=47762 RepID=A0ABW1FER6_9ACTN